MAARAAMTTPTPITATGPQGRPAACSPAPPIWGRTGVGIRADAKARFALLQRRTAMTNLRLLGAAAILSTALAGPALAQQVISNPGYCAQFYPNANCQNKGPGNPYTERYRSGWRSSYNSWDDGYRRGAGPADVAAGAVAGAVGTAGAIATAPFRDDYAYSNGY